VRRVFPAYGLRLTAVFAGLLVAVLLGTWAALAAALDGHGEQLGKVFLTAIAVSVVLSLGAAVVVERWLARAGRRLLGAVARMERRGRAFRKLRRPVGDVEQIHDRLLDSVARIAEERDRFESVLKGMDAGVLALDAEERITVTNPALLDLLGVSGDNLGRHYLEVLPLQLEDCVTPAREGRSARVEFELPGPQRRHLVAYASPRDAGGGLSVVLRDVTAIRHLERVRRDFVANVSHELRTPVSVIQASAETLLSGALEDPQVARSFISAIDRHASRLTRIIAGLLDLARLEAGQRGMARERVNVRASALRAVDLVSSAADARGVDVAIEIDEGIVVWGDTKGVDQILSNLLENAVKYGETEGHVRVSARLAGEARDTIRIEVADDGPGIKPKHRTRVFERFYRVDKGRSRDQGGTGLGLAIVKHLVLAMGGEVGVDPREPGGSVFWVELRAAPPEGAPES